MILFLYLPNSELPEFFNLITFLTYSMIVNCIPKQIPKKGTLFSLANFIASNFPEIPLFPKPPGINTPEADFNNSFTFFLLMVSESIHLIITLA